MEEIILKHRFLPKHEILSEEEAEKILKKYNVSKRQLPKIRLKDPVIKVIGAKEGDLIKITRKSPTSKESPYYRVVVDE